MSSAALNPMSWFPYSPRPHQDRAVIFASEVFSQKSVGLLSADCGVGKTIAVLSGYLAARFQDTSSRLFALTRTHSQSRVFETELEILRTRSPELTATTMLSRIHMCPLRSSLDSDTSTGFMRSCASMVQTGRCTHYWNFYRKPSNEGRLRIRDHLRGTVDGLLDSGIVTRERIEDLAHNEGICPYELMRWCARKSRVIIGPYGYLFQSRVRDALLSSLGLELHEIDVLVDEAHNLSGHALNSETARISGEDLKWLRNNRAAVIRDSGMEKIGDAVDFLWETVMVKLDSLRQRTEITLKKWDVAPRFISELDLSFLFESNRSAMGDPDGVSLTETPFDKLLEFLYAASRATKSEDWHVTLNHEKSWQDEVNISNTQLMIRPLNAAGLTAPVLHSVRAAVLMSGTLRPTDHYARLLGITRALIEDLASPYPRESRLVLLDRTLTTRYQQRGPELWRDLANRINVVLEAMPANKSALIAFPSYKMMHDIVSYGINTGYRGILVESRSEKIETVAEAIEEGPQAIFCVYAGKFSEGIDIVSGGTSQIDLIIGVGIPFGPPTRYQKALQDW
ncbi:MAG: helicase C-terminal domain-containing protein, partial [Candidatus Thorarchaeota archaeon]